jgi:FkbM family methyltransferase
MGRTNWSEDFPKVFLDIGCNHPLTHNNSHFFQVHQGYRVVAVDALREAGELWREHRAAADFVECAEGAVNGEVSFQVVEGSDFDSMFSAVTGASHHQVAANCVTRTVEVRRISDILAERNIRCAGIVSIDIEGYELQALQGIDFDNFFAYVFIIENNSDQGAGSNLVRDLMISKGYRYFARIWSFDDIFIHPDLLALR